jgi:predicted nuclease of predicted toxin-antitoxin system
MPLADKLDEDLPESLAAEVAAFGYDVATVRGHGWGGMKDPQLWPMVQAERRFFVTADREFADLRKFPPGTHAGVPLLRPSRESIVEFKRLLVGVTKAHRPETLVGRVAVATDYGLRIRRSEG